VDEEQRAESPVENSEMEDNNHEDGVATRINGADEDDAKSSDPSCMEDEDDNDGGPYISESP
jgi:hypothetical protein